MGKKVGPYEVQKKIGSGRFGAVYQACNTSTGSLAALKAVPHRGLSAGVMKLVESEVKAIQRLLSPYLLRIYDVYKTARFIYVAMELCKGGDLQQKVKESGRIDERHARRLIIEMLEGVAYLQGKGIDSRDFSLSRFLLTDSDIETTHIKVASFGLFRRIYFNSIPLTSAGNPLYIAPEVFSDEESTLKADTWSLGTVFYELLTGFAPFQAETIAELREDLRKSLHFPEEILLSRDLKEAVFNMIRYSPDSRPSLTHLLSLPVFNREVDAISEESSPATCGGFEVIEIEESYPDLALQYMEIPIVEETSPNVATVIGDEASAATASLLLQVESELVQSERLVSYAEMMEKEGKLSLAIAIFQRFDEILIQIHKEIEEIASLSPHSIALSDRVAQFSMNTQQKLSLLREQMINSSLTDAQSLLLLESTLIPADESNILCEAQRLLRLSSSEGGSVTGKLRLIRFSLLLTSIVFQRFPSNAESERLLSQCFEAQTAVLRS